jgi:thymidylate synthase (FAD)
VGEKTELVFTDRLTVREVKSDFSDGMVCQAAWTSTKGEDTTDDVREGLINRLMKDRHGSPFEHMSATFLVTAPLFVWREHHRHRIASYNEESGRYKKLDPVFYLPGPERPLRQVEGTKQMDYQVESGTDEQYEQLRNSFTSVCAYAYSQYEKMLEMGIVREVARQILPLNIMSTCVVTMNARALMNFLSLRIRDNEAMFPSKPMVEIEMIAQGYELMFAQYAPETYKAFIRHGRVQP